MRTLPWIIVLWALLLGCKKSEVSTSSAAQPGEVAAVITQIDLTRLGDCSCCASYQIQVGSDKFEADQLPVPFESLRDTVWLTYNRQQPSGICSQVQNRISILSIRNR